MSIFPFTPGKRKFDDFGDIGNRIAGRLEMRRPAYPVGTMTLRRRRGRRGGGGSVSGVLGPDIPYPVKKKPLSMFQLFGSYGQDEVYGTQEKDEMIYLGLTSAKITGSGTGEGTANVSLSGSIMYHVAAALLRDILKKEFNEDIATHEQPVLANYLDWNPNQGPQISFIYRNDPLATANTTYGVGYTVKLDDGVGNNMPRQFGDIARIIAENVLGADAFGGVAGTANYGVRTLYGYFVTLPEMYQVNTTGVQRQTGVRRLDKKYLVAYSTAEMMLQNVTLADNVGVNDLTTQRLADRVDSNPLDCRVFKFSTPLPRVRNDGVQYVPANDATSAVYPGVVGGSTRILVDGVAEAANQLNFDTNGDGVIIPANNITGNWTQLPNTDQFYNCTAVEKFKLAPGEIRRFRCKFNYEGNLNKFIHGFASVAENTSQRYNHSDAFGTSYLFCAEKAMSTGTSVKVTVNYQTCFYAGAYMKKDKKQTIKPFNKYGTYTVGAADTAPA